MINSNSLIFRYSEKAGLIFGKVVKYMVVSGIVIFIGGKLGGSQPPVNPAPPEALTAGVVTAAELVCGKAFKQRFGEVLMGACLNLVGC